MTEAPLATDVQPRVHEVPHLRPAARRGARAGLLTSLGGQLVSLLATAVLARLLTPEDIGLVAAANIVLAATVLLTHFGLNSALIQRAHVDRTVSSTIFWASAAVGLIACGLVAAFAEQLAAAMSIADAEPFILGLAPVVFLRLLSGVPRALLQRDLRFARIYVVEAIVLLVTAVAQVALALRGFGAWSMIAGHAIGTCLLLVLFLSAARWRPSFSFSFYVLRADARFSAGMLATTFFSYLGKNADYWFVAHALGARALGLYYIAYALPTVLRQRVTWIGKDILVPVFARLRPDVGRTQSAYVETLRLHAFFGFTAMLGLTLTASDVVAALFGPKWSGTAGPLAVLSLAAVCEFLKQPATTVFVAHGVPGRTAVLEAVRLAVMTSGLLIATAADAPLTGFALAVLSGSAASAAAAQAMVARQVGAGPRVVGRTLLPVVVPGLAMTLVVGVAYAVLELPPGAVRLAVLVPLGAVAYLGTACLLFRAVTVATATEVATMLGPRSRTPAFLPTGATR